MTGTPKDQTKPADGFIIDLEVRLRSAVVWQEKNLVIVDHQNQEFTFKLRHPQLGKRAHEYRVYFEPARRGISLRLEREDGSPFRLEWAGPFPTSPRRRRLRQTSQPVDHHWTCQVKVISATF